MNRKQTKILETQRLVFTTWDEGDQALAFALWGDHEVTKWISGSDVLSEEEVEARLAQEIEREKQEGVQYWALFQKRSDVFVGCCGLYPYTPEENTYELGFLLTRDHWGQGYAQEAAQAVVRYAFDKLEVATLVASHHPDNEAACHILSQLGFEPMHERRDEATGVMKPFYRLRKNNTAR
ncbi:GNAT family N-acetyltransferase [Paenibacillus polysaccharolyticus]|uniref:GNAT family N-acetyltransferase n=1 Tax=Paenibacillus polysaccharolyticus TaxID=582692 RepID=UPI002040BAC5|nr:GNAT family N-acetyltransferase [Paenibacillus polysaccharolyticus]MCM3135385.1 GNAT family N-acetyltransferase [Paenibacillus polysaccharolyticus]